MIENLYDNFFNKDMIKVNSIQEKERQLGTTGKTKTTQQRKQKRLLPDSAVHNVYIATIRWDPLSFSLIVQVNGYSLNFGM